MPLEKEEFEQILDKRLTRALEDQAATIIEAINFRFEQARKQRQEIKDILASVVTESKEEALA